ncbi:MAG TPA: hypothetical protein DCS93_44310 [Microscillaceae bacterium]|nr:hypothetical protein [Microscillaceae bacterium]
MKILLVNTMTIGGAISCTRVHTGLLDKGYDSHLLTLWNDGNIAVPRHELMPLPSPPPLMERVSRKIGLSHDTVPNKDVLFANKSKKHEIFFLYHTYHHIHKHPLYKEADIVNFHMMGYMLDFVSFFKNNDKKMVWTLHEMSAFTGGCAFAEDCRGYQQSCQDCPQLVGTPEPNIAQTQLAYKLDTFSKKSPNLNVVAPSNWLLNSSKESRLFNQYDHHLIPYGVEIDIFKPMSGELRQELGLPADKKILLFVAGSTKNYRKGLDLLLGALENIQNADDLLICTVGSKDLNLKTNVPTHHFGRIEDKKQLAKVYNIADVFVAPSREDNLPNTVLESIACGTPVIAFNIGGMPDMIKHGENGILCGEATSNNLQKGIEGFLKNEYAFDSQKIYQDAQARYYPARQIDAYIELFEKIHAQK